jgi:hypothetical protein
VSVSPEVLNPVVESRGRQSSSRKSRKPAGSGGSDAARFGHAARVLAAAARAAGLTVPAFRTPPRREAARTIRRLPGGVIVAVRLRDRPFAEVVADMVEGVVVANELEGGAATRVRSMLFGALGESSGRTAA